MVMASVISLAGCLHPAPGEKGNRQTYRPLMQHLHRTNPVALAGFTELKKSDPKAYQKRLVEFFVRFFECQEAHLVASAEQSAENG